METNLNTALAAITAALDTYVDARINAAVDARINAAVDAAINARVDALKDHIQRVVEGAIEDHTGEYDHDEFVDQDQLNSLVESAVRDAVRDALGDVTFTITADL